MILFILGILLVVFSSSKAASIFGAILVTIGMMMVIADERIKAHKLTCPGCWKYEH